MQLDAVSSHGKMLIRGVLQEAASGKRFEVRNPATDEVVGSAPSAGREETIAALDAAAAAFPEWRDRPASERAAVLLALAQGLRADRERFAMVMTAEQGKPLAEARGEVEYAATFLEWAAEEGKRLGGEIIPANSAAKRLLVLARPVGVTAAITPWNFPLAMITRKLGSALAVGCTQVVKPAEQTPLSALALGALARDAGVPPGVLNVVTGEPVPIVEALFAHRVLRKVSFTGSTEVGRELMRRAADRVVRLSLELGGHAPFIVFADADLDRAVAGAIASKFRNAGQTCICANRFLVERSVHDAFVERLAAAMSSLTVGPGDVDGISIGPLIDDAAMRKVEAHVTEARDGGAQVVVGGRRATPRDPRGRSLADRFFEPTLLTGVRPGMRCTIEETFGPVAPVQVFDSEAQAIELANDTPYGLAAYLYTGDVGRLWRVAERLDFGVIGANDALPSTAQAPFGGVKQSGFGREGGHHGLREYIDLRYISLGL
ncbi:MAG: NAD-dependent succinate-semialdehyde dehydrogenase [Phycisphaeraceae bacterium]|nr:NAD-dependent succinate-semialdehyde dehydrogenase [Phycisphaeraceae bacterium]